MVNLPTVQFTPRLSQERGNADHDWLKTFHTFSFSTARYQEREHGQFGSLRVINEDWVAARTGFGTHSHRKFEIFSYIVSGPVERKDSMGNTTGTGISHSEKAHGATAVHFLQIWSLLSIPRLQPKYFTRHFTDAEKRDVWARVVAPGKGPAPVQSPLTLYATLLSEGRCLTQAMAGSKGYIHAMQTSGYNTGAATGAAIKVFGSGGVEWELKERDGAYIHFNDAHELTVENVGDMTAEALLFDIE
ncbi:RmlC-like cupin domain-containing protein [Mycena rosella]|uniref:RmlC-like cupin domain-containing protein n=1 Tax=Mycena rosella TaxID=1033263 RepID=A0AAD7G4Y6_MYCRO|nr:RmlC-like cupin domain-containing protein [Mycena rosella]